VREGAPRVSSAKLLSVRKQGAGLAQVEEILNPESGDPKGSTAGWRNPHRRSLLLFQSPAQKEKKSFCGIL